MYENKTWGAIFQMLRDQAYALGRAPHLNDIPRSMELISGLLYGGWSFVLGHAGIYYRFGPEESSGYPLFLEDFSDEQLITLVRKSARKDGQCPRERDCLCYIECVYRWGSWEETLKACGLEVPAGYEPRNPLPAPVDTFHKFKLRRLRLVNYRYRDLTANSEDSSLKKGVG